MTEDEFDFADQNPATHLPLDEKAVPFDYAAQLRQKGHTLTNPPDMDKLFRALATDHVPTRVINLPPKIVRRVRISDFFARLPFFIFPIGIYLFFVGFFGIFLPYRNVASFDAKIHLLPGATCTITSKSVETYSGGDSGDSYDPVVNFTLHTPAGKLYQAHENWPPSYSQPSDAQQYISMFQLKKSYTCWYNSKDPTEASFFEAKIGFWDYFWLVGDAITFLLFAVLPNLVILLAIIGNVIQFIKDGDNEQIQIIW